MNLADRLAETFDRHRRARVQLDATVAAQVAERAGARDGHPPLDDPSTVGNISEGHTTPTGTEGSQP